MIDIRDYDLALLARFKHYYSNTYWINKPNFKTTEVFDNSIFEGKQVSFPLLTLRRVSGPYIYKETNGWAQDRTGLYDPKSGIEFVSSNYQLTYEVDVLSYDRDNFDELLVEVQENLIRHPYLSFNSNDPDIPGVSIHLDFNEVEDNSDLESFSEKNPLYRATLTLELRAYIYRKYRAVTINTFDIQYNIVDSDLSLDAAVESSLVIRYLVDQEIHFKLVSNNGVQGVIYNGSFVSLNDLHSLYGMTQFPASLWQVNNGVPICWFDIENRVYWSDISKLWSEVPPEF